MKCLDRIHFVGHFAGPSGRFQVVCQKSTASGVTGGRIARGDTLQGVTPERNKFSWGNLQRIVDRRGGTGKKGVG